MKTRNITIILAACILAACNSGDSSSSTSRPQDTSPPIDVETRSFAAAGFVNISIDGSFDVVVRRGPGFLVEVSMDLTEIGKLDVGVDGDVLRVGFIPGSDVRADTLEAVIEMPMLDGITLTGSNYVTFTGFARANLNVSLDGNNILEGMDSRIDYVMASVSGSSSLDLAGVTALPSAHIDLSGSSSATLNLMDYATVTGSLFGTSSFSYYGSNVNMQLNGAPTSSTRHLGDTL